MRTWQGERRKRTRHLIELVGLVAKSGVVDLTDDDRAVIDGAPIWMADKLNSDDREKRPTRSGPTGKQAFDAECKGGNFAVSREQHDRV